MDLARRSCATPTLARGSPLNGVTMMVPGRTGGMIRFRHGRGTRVEIAAFALGLFGITERQRAIHTPLLHHVRGRDSATERKLVPGRSEVLGSKGCGQTSRPPPSTGNIWPVTYRLSIA